MDNFCPCFLDSPPCIPDDAGAQGLVTSQPMFLAGVADGYIVGGGDEAAV